MDNWDPNQPGMETGITWVDVLSDLPSWGQLRKKVLFYFQKLKSVPVTQLRRKSLQFLRFSHDLIRLFIKKLKKFHKKNNFSMILLAIILLPLKYPIWAMAKLRQFSHFLQQINKSVSHPFSKIQTRAPSLFPFVRCPNLHKSKTPIKYEWEEVTEVQYSTTVLLGKIISEIFKNHLLDTRIGHRALLPNTKKPWKSQRQRSRGKIFGTKVVQKKHEKN